MRENKDQNNSEYEHFSRSVSTLSRNLINHRYYHIETRKLISSVNQLSGFCLIQTLVLDVFLDRRNINTFSWIFSPIFQRKGLNWGTNALQKNEIKQNRKVKFIVKYFFRKCEQIHIAFAKKICKQKLHFLSL